VGRVAKKYTFDGLWVKFALKLRVNVNKRGATKNLERKLRKNSGVGKRSKEKLTWSVTFKDS